MTNLCAACGANLDMVGRAHRCVPRNTPEASGTARKASSGSLLGGPSRNSVRASTLAKVGDGITLTSMAHPPGLVEKIVGAIRSGKLKASLSNPVAKEPEASGHNRREGPQGALPHGSSRVSAGRTAQDVPQPSPAGAVAILKRGRPRKPLDQLSRSSRYRRKKETK